MSADALIITRRLTSAFLQAVPPHVQAFDAYLYAIVKRRPGKDQPGIYGKDVRLDPCELNWDQRSITMTIPYNINHGITSADDLDPSFYESVQAAFLALLYGCIP